MRKGKIIYVSLVIASLFFSLSLSAQEAEKKQFTFLLSGASFASPTNGWFEVGCDILNVTALNRAKGSEAIAHTANRIIDGTLYTTEELDDIDALVIMQVHNRDVFDETQLKEEYSDYETPLNKENYAAAFDYVIKRFYTDCYNLKFNENSKYYNSRSGKPAVIVLCTDWHDARETYNGSVRMLAQKWGLPLVEFDKYIGFSKEVRHPVTKEPISRLLSKDTQEIDGVTYGWHPERGTDQYIQQRMGEIFADTMRRIFPIKGGGGE